MVLAVKETREIREIIQNPNTSFSICSWIATLLTKIAYQADKLVGNCFEFENWSSERISLIQNPKSKIQNPKSKILFG
jgi:hypothetical protein